MDCLGFPRMTKSSQIWLPVFYFAKWRCFKSTNPAIPVRMGFLLPGRQDARVKSRAHWTTHSVAHQFFFSLSCVRLSAGWLSKELRLSSSFSVSTPAAADICRCPTKALGPGKLRRSQEPRALGLWKSRGPWAMPMLRKEMEAAVISSGEKVGSVPRPRNPITVPWSCCHPALLRGGGEIC